MANFAYIARTASGERVTGQLAGATRHGVLAELESRQLAPIEVNEVAERSKLLQRRVNSRQLARAYRQLADLMRAGVPLLRSLRLLGRSKSTPRLAAVMRDVAADVADGGLLADAFAARPDVFPDIQIAMVRAGERGGFLREVLERLGVFLEHQADLRGRVIGNLIYPVLLLALGTVVVIGALIFFVPRFRPYYADMDVPLPTTILLTLSDLFTTQWMTGLSIVVGVAALVWWLARRPGMPRRVTGILMKTPTLGPLLANLAIARFARILGTMLENGIPLLAAMQVSRDAAGNLLLAEALDEATEAVRAGETLAGPLGASGLVSDDVVEMIAVGESANNLPDVLLTIAETIEKRVDRLLAVFLRLMEPLLLLILAGVVLFIFVALVVPMLNLSSAV